MSRLAFTCPNCGPAVGTFINALDVRCDWRLVPTEAHPNGWRSVQVGTDRKKRPVYEHIPKTAPGCGGILGLCQHGLRICTSCTKPSFRDGDGSHALEELSAILERETKERKGRERAAKEAQKTHAPRSFTPAFAQLYEDTSKMARAFAGMFGDPEPTKYTPPTGRRKKST